MGEKRDRFIAFLKSKKFKACEACNVHSWGIPDEDHGLAVSVPIQQPGGGLTLPMPQVPAFIAVCNNCGNIRLHAINLVDKWDGTDAS